MNTDELRILLNGHGICEKLDDFENRGLPDLGFYSGGHTIWIFTEWTEQQQQFAKRISFQLAPHFIWKYLSDVNAIQQYDEKIVYVPYELHTTEHVVEWLNRIEEDNKDYDYLAKYSEES